MAGAIKPAGLAKLPRGCQGCLLSVTMVIRDRYIYAVCIQRQLN